MRMCMIAEMDRAAEAALADFNDAEERFLLAQRKRNEVDDRLTCICAAAPAKSRRGLLAQVRELGIAVMLGQTERCERLVALITEGVESIVPDDAQ